MSEQIKQVLFTDEDERNLEIVAQNLKANGVDVEPDNSAADIQYSPTKIVRYLLAQAAQEITEKNDDQAYFWTEEWQAGEREADEDIAAGRVKTFDTMEEFLADLMSDDDE